MKRALVFAAVYTASLAFVVVVLALVLSLYVATSDRAIGIAITSSTLPVLLVTILLLGVFSSWLTRKLLRSKATDTQNAP
jgi:flagellar biosynthesis protein FliQ